jgi:prepilin-type processing-associated H-X9-DG protein
MHCGNNLKQIGLAIQNYETTCRCLPAARTGTPHLWSASAQILPCLEGNTVFNIIDFRKSPLDVANAAAVRTVIPTYLCPSDPRPERIHPDFGGNNYVANAGTGVASSGSFRPEDGPQDGVFYDRSAVRWADIRDGLSNTAAYSETTKGSGQDSSGPAPASAGLQYAQGSPAGPLSDSYCAALAFWSGQRGREWARGSFIYATFNHYLPPNSKTSDCLAGNVFGRIAARSLHRGGVNVVFCDGHVAFVHDGVELATWRALATRNGSEVVSSGTL